MAVAAGGAPGAEAPDPAKNIPLGELPASCSAHTSVRCENAVVYYLNQARASMGLPTYDLPADFPQLPPDRQIFILSDLDRIAYSLSPVAGLNSELSGDASQGVAFGGDPAPSAWSYDWNAYFSNWAGAFTNAPAAYYFWMYDDGPGSGNLDCNDPSDSGCWGHRHDILFDEESSGEYEAAMGAATGTKRENEEVGYAMLIVAALRFSQQPPYYYTWAEAQADGAGTYPYDPGVPDFSHPESNFMHLTSPHLRLRLRRATLHIGDDSVLLGRRVEVTVRREVVPCAIKLNASRCTWVLRGPIRRKQLRLSDRVAIPLRPPSAWERVSVHARVPGFESNGQRYTASVASLFLRGPKPHHFAR